MAKFVAAGCVHVTVVKLASTWGEVAYVQAATGPAVFTVCVQVVTTWLASVCEPGPNVQAAMGAGGTVVWSQVVVVQELPMAGGVVGNGQAATGA